MKNYAMLSRDELQKEQAILANEMALCKAKNLDLNMARGKPGADQLDLSMPMLSILNQDSNIKDAIDGTDCRNYSTPATLCGTPEARTLFGEYLGASKEQTIVVGSTSLSFMYDCLAKAMLTGVLGSEKPWSQEKIKFLCPVPGYDRHFSICEFLGIEMISIPCNDNGPDMDQIEKLVSTDASIKGMWCVPKYANPSGITYSTEVLTRMANLAPLAKDFRIFCDNAYAMHQIYEDTYLPNLLELFEKAGNPNMIYIFGSTNKITFPGAGVAFFAASKENIAFAEKQLSMQAIGYDKLNMLRHVRFLKDIDGIKAHMAKHADILRPKFDAVISALETEVAPRGAGTYTKPMGGYFVTYYAPKGCAKRIVALCKEMGVVLTGAGATYPYGKDPDDSCLRIAPSFPSANELTDAMVVFCIAARIATIEKYLA